MSRSLRKTSANPPPDLSVHGTDREAYPAGHISVGVMASSSFNQVSVRAQISTFCVCKSILKSAVLLTIEQQFIVAKCAIVSFCEFVLFELIGTGVRLAQFMPFVLKCSCLCSA